MSCSSYCGVHCTAVQTPTDVPDAPVICKSRNSPATTFSAPDEKQLLFVEAEQLRAVPAMLPGVPALKVTVMTADCCEYTWSFVAVQVWGTQASTDAVSVALAFGVLME